VRSAAISLHPLPSLFRVPFVAKTAYRPFLLLQPPTETFLRISHIAYETGAGILVQGTRAFVLVAQILPTRFHWVKWLFVASARRGKLLD
jgi:hypothetical protein